MAEPNKTATAPLARGDSGMPSRHEDALVVTSDLAPAPDLQPWERDAIVPVALDAVTEIADVREGDG